MNMIPPIIIDAEPTHGAHASRKCSKCQIDLPKRGEAWFFSCHNRDCPSQLKAAF